MLDLEEKSSHIPASLLRFSGTGWDAGYAEHCRQRGLRVHPARMPSALAAFFVQFLTHPHDLVVDPFAGSNTTGAVAEALGRRWIAVEADPEYVRGSRGRFAKGGP